jgi:hypothetical protein
MIIPLSIECCQKLVPEDSVRPEARTLVVLNRRKGCVGCFNFFSYISRLIKNIRNLWDRLDTSKEYNIIIFVQCTAIV